MFNPFSSLSPWDWALVIVVSLFGTISAFVRDPQVKAVFATVPVPFALAWIAVGLPVGVQNAAAVFMVLAYVHVVRWLHEKHWPILGAIAMGILVYVGGGIALVKLLPSTEILFWSLLILGMNVGGFLLRTQPIIVGTPYRTPLHPIPKFFAMFGVVLALAFLKKMLLGFTPFFPMMNSITSYEARHSLWVQCRQIPAFMVAAGPMLGLMRYLEVYLQLHRALVLSAGMVVYMLLFLPLNAWLRKQGTKLAESN